MMTLPEGFDVSLLVGDFVNLATPIVGVLMLFAVYSLISRVLKLL